MPGPFEHPDHPDHGFGVGAAIEEAERLRLQEQRTAIQAQEAAIVAAQAMAAPVVGGATVAASVFAALPATTQASLVAAGVHIVAG